MRKQTLGALIALGTVFTIFFVISGVTFSSKNGTNYNQSQYENEDNTLSLQEMYSDRTDSPINNPALHENSTEDLQAPFTEIKSVMDNDNQPVNATGGRYTLDDKYMMIEFNATDESEIKHYECADDGKNWVLCKSPVVIYNTNGNGTKTIEIRAVDIHNNIEQQPASILYETR